MKIKSIVTIILGLFVFSVTSCKKSVNPTDLKSNYEISLDKNLLQSPNRYAELIQKRATEKVKFTIEDIKRDGNTLLIITKGGCKEDDFNVVWDGQLYFSYPAQINLLLYHNASSDCENNKEFTIKVNLKKILGEHDPKNFIFNVANGSLQQDKSLNQDGTIANK